MKKRVVVAMSGGVDSSVSAFLLKEAGYEVIGLFMKNWEEKDERGVCKASIEYEDVEKVADVLQIPYYSVQFVEEYQELVFSHFLKELKEGKTPNPDILCNREIKFKHLLNKAISLGADFLATGHYCRLRDNLLLKGKDPNKDQSYFLHAVSQQAFEKVLFPIGDLFKDEVRKIARKAQLPTSEKKDSTGICFIGKRDFKSFLSSFLGYQKGKIKTLSGKVVGEHDGVAYYTIGQRKGIGLGGEGKAWFVVGKDLKENVVYVERGENHPALFQSKISCSFPSWIDQPSSFPYRCSAKIRYRQQDQLCTIISQNKDQLLVEFDEPQRAVTSGQSIVFYQEDRCLGGAVID